MQKDTQAKCMNYRHASLKTAHIITKSQNNNNKKNRSSALEGRKHDTFEILLHNYYKNKRCRIKGSQTHTHIFCKYTDMMWVAELTHKRENRTVRLRTKPGGGSTITRNVTGVVLYQGLAKLSKNIITRKQKKALQLTCKALCKGCSCQ